MALLLAHVCKSERFASIGIPKLAFRNEVKQRGCVVTPYASVASIGRVTA